MNQVALGVKAKFGKDAFPELMNRHIAILMNDLNGGWSTKTDKQIPSFVKDLDWQK